MPVRSDAKRQRVGLPVPRFLPLPPVRSGGVFELIIPGNTEQPCHLMMPSPTAKVRAVSSEPCRTYQCDGRETCLTATCSGVQLNADTPSGTPWSTQPLHRTPNPKPWRTLNSVQVSRTGIQEVSPRMFSGCPQVGPRSAPSDPPPDPPPAVGMTQVRGRPTPADEVSRGSEACPSGASEARGPPPEPQPPGSSARCARGARA